MVQNYYLISNKESNSVIDQYNKLLQQKNSLYTMNVISLQSENIVDDIIKAYSVTDKADGEHYGLLILNNEIYLISNNLEIKHTNIKLSNSEYNNTILDGELIYLKENKNIYLLVLIFYIIKIKMLET